MKGKKPRLLRILEGRERWVCGELLGEGRVLREDEKGERLVAAMEGK